MDTSVILYGYHTVKELLNYHPEVILELFCDLSRKDQKIQPILDLAETMQIKIHPAEKSTLDKLAVNSNHQSIVAKCRQPHAKKEHELDNFLDQLKTSAPLLLVLDGLQDPHNLGACMRTANATNVDAIIAPRNRAVSLTPTVFKVASGAALSIPYFQVTNLVRVLKGLQTRGIWLVGADADAGQTLFHQNFTGSIAIVMGAEGRGLRRLTREQCDFLMNIPMLGSTESLNVSVATGVFLYEALRQRHFKDA